MEPNRDRNINTTNTRNESNVHTLYSSRPGQGLPVDNTVHERDSWRISLEKLYDDMSRLWVKESQLIRTEMNEKVTQVKAASGALIGGGTLLFVGLLCLAATAIIGLNNIMSLWIASMIVTVAFFVIGGVMIGAAKKKLAVKDLKPTRSVEALGEIKSTFKERVYEFRKH